ncbi:aminoglycoside phosphotransferase family protein [Pseudalkalibacillus hwajinpoensis]|uniref:aminoglycoside phosphotransferase family protein n=1 Tax=Guptibacillus hwajinpoensis TaxID=208199 RepID=UPI00146D485E|nr:aminoglycoside phosphotransferase family protein [Pseudalkalibacillus hwajinpoensis]
MREILQKYLKEKYGEFTPTRLVGGYTNDTYLINATCPQLVAKVGRLSNSDLKNEVNSLEITKEISVVPKIYDYIKKDGVQIIVMEYCEGINGQSILDHNDLETTKILYRVLGKTLSNSVHSLKFKPNLKPLNQCNIKEINLDLDFVPEILIQRTQKILNNVDDKENDWVLTHGDYGIHNVLFTKENSITVLDWEWAEWANPLIDVGWVCWFTKLHYPHHSDILNSIFINEYKIHSSVELSSDKLKAYCLYKVWKVLNKVTQAPEDVRQEWVRRLRWTLDTDLI